MRSGFLRWLNSTVLTAAIVVAAAGPAVAQFAPGPSPASPDGDTATIAPGAQPLPTDEEAAQRLLELDFSFTSRRTSGDLQLTNEQAGDQRSNAAVKADAIKQLGTAHSGPVTFNSAWSGLGPNPIVQVTRSDNSFAAMSGRIGALAIRRDGTFILGAAQGGIWTFDSTTGKWTPRTDNLASLSIGALGVAPSNDMIVYAGTGEGALSGDSYFGNGILKSTDGGATWAHVSGDFFKGVSISRLLVDPENANHIFISVLRGRGGARRVSPPLHSRFGIWESTNGAVSWTLLKETPAGTLGATDIEMDPQNTQTMYSSFWGDKIYKSQDGGHTWTPIMNGLPVANYAAVPTRFSIAISHPEDQAAVLYAGFDWVDATGHHPARIFKSTDEGASWTITGPGTGADTVADYCGGQCFYDNVIETDPTNPNIVFAAGQFNYGIGSGGIFRSDDGGATWKNLGWNQHPDFHALAFDPNNSTNVIIGSDGGVWYGINSGGRPNASDPLSAVTWVDLSGSVNPATAGVTGRTNLQISQFTSIATIPTCAHIAPPACVNAGANSERFWGGTQDNGTLRKSVNSQTWFDVASGDGGQVVVDPTNVNFVYGTYFGISPYRYTDGGLGFFTNQFITGGINLRDRSDFYIPLVVNKNNPNQLFTGTFRLYRTDNAKAPSSGDVLWSAISPDLTSGCPGTAPNGARNCTISAIGVGGGTAVYTGSLDGFVYFSADAQTNPNPSWTLLGASGQTGEGQGNGDEGGNIKLPQRPVSQIAVDRSNYRIAYVSYNGYNAATPHRPGHVFKTTDAGNSWKDISGNLPDVPVNSVILDPSYPNVLYAGTDVGPFVTNNGGRSWRALGTGFPIVAIWQLDLNTHDRILAAGTHGRGAFRLQDNSKPVPALVLSKVDSGVPVGPGSNIDYALTLNNIGNADAKPVTITDQIPQHTMFVSADSGGTLHDGRVTWTGLSVPAGGTASVHLTVRIDANLESSVKSIVNDGLNAISEQGPSTTGSPTVTPIAPPFALTLTPATQTDGARAGQSVTYNVTLKNLGFTTDSYKMSASGGTYAVSFLDATCTSALTTTGSVIAGATTNVCVKVDVPGGAANGDTNTATITATSVGSPGVSASGTVKTVAVTVATLLVDNGDKSPDTQPIYRQALTDAGVAFSVWDLTADTNIPVHYMEAFKQIIWFSANRFPGPILPYESKLKAYLDNGGRLFLSGQDLLDQAAGTTAFVQNYLHVTWDGTETQNDKATNNVHGVAANPVTGAVGTVPLDSTVLGNKFMDEITPNGGASPAFTDDAGQTDGLTFSNSTYRVMFVAFAFEEYGTPAQKASLISSVIAFFA